MKIVIVRGAFLNPFECQLYAPLARNHEIALVGADWQFYQGAIAYSGTAVRSASLWGACLAAIHRMAPVAANRLLSWTMGRSFGFYDLDQQTRGADILHSAETFFTMTHQCVVLKRARQCALVITVSENLPHMGERHPVRRRLKKEAIDAADRLIAITETTRRMLIGEGISSERITVIPWSLDLSRFKPAPKDAQLLLRLAINPQDFVILFVGRFIPEKGIRDILHVVSNSLLQAKGKPIKFLFVGDGPLASDIRAAQRRYPDLIRLQPFAPYEQLPSIHNLADVFILPSKAGHKIAEQFGFVLIESMACGKPIITTSVGSIRDVAGDAALLVEPGQPEALALELNRLLESESLRAALSSKSLTRVREHFDAEKNAKRLEAVYEDALRRVR